MGSQIELLPQWWASNNRTIRLVQQPFRPKLLIRHYDVGFQAKGGVWVLLGTYRCEWFHGMLWRSRLAVIS